MQEEWVDICDDLPQLRVGYTNVSVDVEVMLKDGTIMDAFYAYNQESWHKSQNGNKIGRYRVIAWRTKEGEIEW